MYLPAVIQPDLKLSNTYVVLLMAEQYYSLYLGWPFHLLYSHCPSTQPGKNFLRISQYLMKYVINSCKRMI